MRRTIAVCLLLVSLMGASTVRRVPLFPAAGGSFCTPFEECDQFNTTNNPATGWTAGPSSGAWQTNGTQMVPPSGTFTALLNNAVAGTTTQYAIVKLVDGDEETGVFFRRTSGSGKYYRVYWTGTNVFWATHDSAAESFDNETAGCATSDFNDGDYMVALVTGTGTSTIVRVWNRGTTAPTAVPTTGDACTTLCCEFIDDMAVMANGGDRVGLYIYTGATVRRFDDFAAGGS